MRPLLAAVVLCWITADATMMALPFRAYATAPAPAIRLVHVCLPPKDQSRHAWGDTLPVRMVPTERFVAADVPPDVQASENRKPKKRR